MKRRIDVASDFHGHEHSPAAVALLCAHLRQHKPHVFVFNGDIVDFCVVSSYGKPGRLAPSTIIEEANSTLVNVIIPILTALDFQVKWKYEYVDPENPALKEVQRVTILECINPRGVLVYWNEGNHEMRLKRHLWSMAQSFDGLITFDLIFSLKKLGIDYVHSTGSAGNGIIHLNPGLIVMHGARHGIHQSKTQAEDVMMSVIMGHGHKEGMFRKSSSITGVDFTGYSCGSMCKNPLYNTVPNFNRGFLSGWYEDEAPYRHSLFHARIVSEKAILPQDAAAYPRRVVEVDNNVLITPWAEYRAVETSPRSWSVSQVWGAEVFGVSDRSPAPAKKRAVQKGKSKKK